MGRWSQRMLRGGGGLASLPGADAPVLTFVPAANLAWVWSDPDPVFWEIETSSDGISGWSNVDEETGNLRGAIAVTIVGEFYRMFGSTNGVDATTGYSNVVQANL